jgi:CubicO group peptidase (beta-lactamase class C family)
MGSLQFASKLMQSMAVMLALGSAQDPAQTTHKLKIEMDQTIAHFVKKFPGLAISAAYTDVAHHIAVAQGTISDYSITTNDTFLYGSGTKPFTAAAVLRLIDSGKVKAADKASALIDPYLSRHGYGSMASILGKDIDDATVLDVIRMSAGIRDFEDNFDFDMWSLASANSSHFQDYPYQAMKWSASALNRKYGGPLWCPPGTCSAYSSTSYLVAGLVVAATLYPDLAWYDVDLGSALFTEPSAYPSMSFPPKGNRSAAKMSQYLTVPGKSYGSQWGGTEIFDQNPSIFGWTCGNMVATPRDVAKYFYNLLDSDAPAPLVSQASRTEMTRFELLTKGWNSGRGGLKYGAGMMELQYGRTQKLAVLGHEGDTYGFMSAQGYIPSLKGAFSIVANMENSNGAPLEDMACLLLQTINCAIGSASPGCSLGCKQFHGPWPSSSNNKTVLV